VTWLLRRLLLWKLRLQETNLVDTVAHGEGLMQDHARRLANAKHELAQVRRRIDLNTDAQDIIRGITT